MSAVLKAQEPSARYLAAVRPGLVEHFDLVASAPGGVARLRELILILAVRGKLVPQDPKDEPACALLARTRIEKKRLVAEGAIRRDTLLRDVREDESLFVLPVGWEWVRLADVVRILNGRAYSKQELLERGSTPVLRVGNLFTSNHWYYSNLDLEPDKYCHPGDLLYAWSASFGPFIWSGPKAIFHYHIWKLDPITPDLLDSRYLHTFLQEKTAEIKAAGHGVSMIHMTKEKMEQIALPYPPLAEQARIVARVEELMHLCDALEAKGRLEDAQHAQLLNALLSTLTDSASPEELAANWQRVAAHFDLLLDRPEAIDTLVEGIVQLAVRGLLVPPIPSDGSATELVRAVAAAGDPAVAKKPKPTKCAPSVSLAEQRFTLPQGWAWVRLESVASEIVDCPHSTPKFVDKGLLCIDTNSFKGGALSPHRLRFVDQGTFEERVERLRPRAGDLVFAREGSVGESLIIPPGTVACLGQRVMLFRFYRQVSTEFVQLAISSRDFLEMLLSLHKGIGAKHVNVGDMRKAAIPLPPRAEQDRIVARVNDLRRLCIDLREKLANIQATQARLADTLVDSAVAAD